MATIGSWGDFTFYVSRQAVKTFDGLKWDSAAKYSTHERHLKEPLLEFTGTDVESMTFTMFFSVYLGVNPIKEVSKLLQAMRRGEVHRLVIGPNVRSKRSYGNSGFYWTKARSQWRKYGNHTEAGGATPKRVIAITLSGKPTRCLRNYFQTI